MEIVCGTPRLYLRQFREDDADAANILLLNSQPTVLHYLHEPPLTSLEDAHNILRYHILPQYRKNLGRWSVHFKANDSFVGWCGLKQRPERNNEIDLGYRFLPGHWGQGIASEAASICLHHAFNQLQLMQVNACAHVENLASLRVLEKIGMEYTHDDTIDGCPVKCFVAHKHTWK